MPVELGLNVCVMESGSGVILHHKVMQHCTDSEIAVDMAQEAKARFPGLSVCSFDKGFHSPGNQKTLAGLLDQVALAVTGRNLQKLEAILQQQVLKKLQRRNNGNALPKPESH